MTENPLKQKLKGKKIILASGSPRRKQFFEGFKVDFEVRVRPVDEVYPETLKGHEISDYLAELKAKVFEGTLHPTEILITSDTVVWHQNQSLEKAKSPTEALVMLRTLSGDWHEVITSVCFTTVKGQNTVHHTTHVKLKEFSEEELHYYIENYKPFDKAGAYGIQEWFGMVGIEEIRGSYNNVVGLPTHLVYETLMHMAS